MLRIVEFLSAAENMEAVEQSEGHWCIAAARAGLAGLRCWSDNEEAVWDCLAIG